MMVVKWFLSIGLFCLATALANPLELDSILADALLPQPEDPEANRDEVIGSEQSISIGGDVHLDDREQQVNDIIKNLKTLAVGFIYFWK